MLLVAVTRKTVQFGPTQVTLLPEIVDLSIPLMNIPVWVMLRTRLFDASE